MALTSLLTGDVISAGGGKGTRMVKESSMVLQVPSPRAFGKKASCSSTLNLPIRPSRTERLFDTFFVFVMHCYKINYMADNSNNSLDIFHKYLVDLNYFKDIEEEALNYLELDKNETEEQKAKDFVQIPIDFIDADDYLKSWQPLFYVESKANI
jgi:hypothetical protein